MMRRFLPLFAVLLGACQLSHGSATPLATPAPAMEWPAVVTQAATEVSAGRYGVADRILTDFTTRYPASGEGTESMYWRALFKLDPSNPNASPREAGVLLDNYMSNASAPHRTEAVTLRRLATTLETRSAAAAAPTAAKPDAPAADKSKDDEIARLRDDLARATAELERIKKRLAQPTKP